MRGPYAPPPDSRLYASSNNGLTWSEIPLPSNQSILGVSKILFNGNYMFIGTRSSWQDGVFMTSNEGIN